MEVIYLNTFLSGLKYSHFNSFEEAILNINYPENDATTYNHTLILDPLLFKREGSKLVYYEYLPYLGEVLDNFQLNSNRRATIEYQSGWTTFQPEEFSVYLMNNSYRTPLYIRVVLLEDMQPGDVFSLSMRVTFLRDTHRNTLYNSKCVFTYHQVHLDLTCMSLKNYLSPEAYERFMNPPAHLLRKKTVKEENSSSSSETDVVDDITSKMESLSISAYLKSVIETPNVNKDIKDKSR